MNIIFRLRWLKAGAPGHRGFFQLRDTVRRLPGSKVLRERAADRRATGLKTRAKVSITPDERVSSGRRSGVGADRGDGLPGRVAICEAVHIRVASGRIPMGGGLDHAGHDPGERVASTPATMNSPCAVAMGPGDGPCGGHTPRYEARAEVQ